jgi:multidrug efflux pump subunit AcrB
MTLGAIAALGLIIDDAVVVEQIHRTMRSILKNLTALLQKQFAISFQPW